MAFRDRSIERRPKRFEIQVYLTIQADKQTTESLAAITARLDRIQQKVEKLIMTDAELKTLLQKLDDTTNHIAANTTVIADETQKISTEIDAFIAAKPVGTVLTDADVALLQGLGARTQAASDASDAQVAALTAIAAKGAPVVPPPPPAPVLG